MSATISASASTALLLYTTAIFLVRWTSLDQGRLELLQTLTTCLVALALTFSGSGWRRIELLWIAYATLVFVAAKLLLKDLRHGHLLFIAASFFLYSTTLILIPHLIGGTTRIKNRGRLPQA